MNPKKYQSESPIPIEQEAPKIVKLQDFGGISFDNCGNHTIMRPQEDITTIETMHLMGLLIGCFMSRNPIDAMEYIQRHKLERHFSYKRENKHGDSANND